MRATRLSGPLLGLAALLALPLLILTAPAAATTTGAFAERSAQPGPPVHAATLSCEQAEAKLQSAKKKLKRAKKKVRAAKKKARKAKKGGKRAKVKKAKRKLKRAKKKLKKAMKRRKRAKAALQDCQDDGPPVVPPPPGDNAQAVANAVLARAPQRPGDINLFTSEFSNGAGPLSAGQRDGAGVRSRPQRVSGARPARRLPARSVR
jgi:F0F1-type ATP synthase membrane subunit b/b'